MKTAGIIAEYNPFHKGHEYQMQYMKENLGADFVIIAMSGDFVQRGTPALFPKHLRAEMALRCGADLVLELPVSAATASAELFARSGVELLDGLGVVDELCFGSEAGETDGLMELAKVFVEEPEAYREGLKRYLSEGMTFPAARSRAVMEYLRCADSDSIFPDKFRDTNFDGIFPNELCNSKIGAMAASSRMTDSSSKKAEALLAEPNNILGIEYCKALLRLGSSMRPVTIQRKGHGYHDTGTTLGSFASATAIRGLISGTLSDADLNNALIQAKEFLPINICELFAQAIQEKAFLTESDFDVLLHCCLLKENADTLCKYLDMSPDLARRVLNQRNACQGFSQFTTLLKTKDLTQTRIQRALLHTLLGIRQAPSVLPYARVLGFRKESSALLKAIKLRSRIPLLTRLANAPTLLDETGMQLLEETTFASNYYQAVLSHKTGGKFVHEYEKKIVIL